MSNMSRKFNEKQLLIASNNPGKVKEISELFAPYNIETISLTHLDIEEPEETGLTFVDNAKLKAAYYGKLLNLPALADDSGLTIDALDGFPGVYSARFAGPDSDFSKAFTMIEQKLLKKELQSSSASFICSLALWWPDDHFEVFSGIIDGNISFPPVKGEHGFGYAPIFTAKGHNKKFSQISNEEKNLISHRAKAFNQLITTCF
jgi:XTP/dITP diphosphohydrolase